IRHAAAIWFGLRLMNLDPGDRVIAVEGHLKDVRLPDHGWQRSASRMAGVEIYDREGEVPRDGTARLYVLGDRMVVFVSPVEPDSVSRMLEHGVDKKRGDPPADGFVGLDLRTHRLPAPVERRFPSVGKLVADLERVRASVTLEDNGLHLDAQISA